MNVYTRTTKNEIIIGNKFLEFGFSKKSGAPVSIRDKKSGYEFLRDKSVPTMLYILLLRKKDRTLEQLNSAKAKHFRTDYYKFSDGMTLVLESGGFPGSNVTVSVEIPVSENSSLTKWKMTVTGVPKDCAVYELLCPVISGVMKIGDGISGECFAAPRQGEGYLFTDPYPVVDNLPLCSGFPENPHVGMGEMHGYYPGGIGVQLMMYYNRYAGLYFACHDAGMHPKGFHLGQLPGCGTFPAIYISHCPSEYAGKDAVFAYDTAVGVFHGDWYDGADIYKQWAQKQWWCERKLAERDTADWIKKGFGVWQMSNYHIPEIKMNHPVDKIANEVNAISSDAGVPVVALIFNFERGGAWTGPAGFFPPKEGEGKFKSAMRKLRKAGNRGFIYMPGGNWYVAIDSYNPPFDSWKEYEKEGRPISVVNEKGKVSVGKWYAGWHSTRLCPGLKGTSDVTEKLLVGSSRLGVDMIQIDNFPCVGPEACYSTKHGHPKGFGPWYVQAWREILSRVRTNAKRENPDVAISTEGIAETYIPYLDLFDHRAGNMEYFGHYGTRDPMGGETIPLFNYIYSGYIGAYLAAYPECNRPEVLYWTRSLGKALTQGVVPTGGRYWPEPKQSNPVTLAFYKKIIRATVKDCWKYIMFGEMLKPPKIKAPEIKASYIQFTGESLDHLLEKNRHVVTDKAVQHSAWRAEDGTIGYIFVNVSTETVTFDFQLSAYSKEKKPRRIDIVTDSIRKVLYKSKNLPCKQKLVMPPLSVTVVEVKP